MDPLDLTQTLKGHQPGEWVVLDASRKKVLAASDDPAEAIELSRKIPASERKDSLLMQVPDPSSVCIY